MILIYGLGSMKYQFETYQLQIVDNEDTTCNIRLLPTTGKALSKERRKLYIISNGDEILYVGEANTSIKTRFQRSCNSYNFYKRNNDIARNGYKGYKWFDKEKNPIRNLTVLAVIFNETSDEKRAFVEAVEGELVFLIRKKTGKWPLFQNEIHFSNCDGALEVAEGVLEKLLEIKLV